MSVERCISKKLVCALGEQNGMVWEHRAEPDKPSLRSEKPSQTRASEEGIQA